MSEDPFVRDPQNRIIGIEFADRIWLFDIKKGWGLYFTDDGPIKFIIPTDQQNKDHGVFWPSKVTWIPEYKTPLVHNEAAFRKAFPAITLEKERLCYFYFGNPDADGGDYPAGQLDKETLAYIDRHNVPVLKLIATQDDLGLKWVPITSRPEDGIRAPRPKEVASLGFYGPKVSILRKHGGRRSVKRTRRSLRRFVRRSVRRF